MEKVNWKELVGRKFKPTFETPINYFEIRGYDEDRAMVLTTAHPKEGEPFDDEIEEQYLIGAFETGDYKAVDEFPSYGSGQFELTARPYLDMMGPVNPRTQVFCGPCCNRCQHRFGTTKNKEFCQRNFSKDNCYRFKLEK